MSKGQEIAPNDFDIAEHLGDVTVDEIRANRAATNLFRTLNTEAETSFNDPEKGIVHVSLENTAKTLAQATDQDSPSRLILNEDLMNSMDEVVRNILDEAPVVQDTDVSQAAQRKVNTRINKFNRNSANRLKTLANNAMKSIGFPNDKNKIDAITELGLFKDENNQPIDLWNDVFSPEARKADKNAPAKYLDKIAAVLATESEVRAFSKPESLGKKKTPSVELSLDENHRDFLGDINVKAGRGGRRSYLDMFRILTEDIAPNIGKFDGRAFMTITTGKNPDSKKQILKAADTVKDMLGVSIMPHPNNPGRLIIGDQDGDFADRLSDIVENTQSGDKVFDLDVRDFSTPQGLEDFVNTWTQLFRGSRPYGMVRKVNAPKNFNTGDTYMTLDQVKPVLERAGLELGPERTDPYGVPYYKVYPRTKYSITEANAAQTKATKQYLKDITDKLKQAWPDIKILTDPKKINEAARRLGVDGNRVKGAYLVGDNTVLLNPDKVTADTPIHEFGHIWAKKLMRENPQLWIKGRDLLKGSKFEKIVRSIPAYRDYSPAQLTEEIMANAIGKRGAQLFSDNTKAKRWDAWMKKIGDWVKSKLGIATAKNYEDLTLNDWLDTAVHGVFSGQVPGSTPTKTYSAKNPIRTEFSVEEKSAAELALEKEQARKVGAKASKKGWFDKATSWMVPPSSDDFHGLLERYNQKHDDVHSKALNKMKDIYVKDYTQYEKNATAARERYAELADQLAEKLGLEVSRTGKLIGDTRGGMINDYLAKDSGIEHNGADLSIQSALEVYTNPAEFSKDLVDKVNDGLNDDFKEFADNLDFAIDGSVQGSLLNHINKNVFKSSMKNFLAYKKANFGGDAMNKIGGKMNDKYQEALSDSLKRMSGSSGVPSDSISQKWNDWLNNSVGAIMFLNVRSAALQGLSIWNYMSPSNIIGFNSDLAKIIASPSSEQKKMFTDLWNDPMMKERRARAGFDVNANEVLEAAKNGDLSKFTQKALNKGFALTSLMDSFAIASGGTAFVRQEMKNGASLEDAKQAWRDKTQEAQQSARPDRVSQQQKAGVSKFILAFANTPAQYFRLSQKAFRTIKQHGITSKEGMAAARKMAYYMAVQNGIFTMMQSASMALLGGFGSDDEKEVQEATNQLNSMMSSVLRGMGLYGAVIDAAKTAALRAYRQSQKSNPDYSKAIVKGALQVSPPLNRKISQIEAIGRAYKYKQERTKTGIRSPHAVAVAKGGEALFNLPTDWVQKKLAAVQALLVDGDADFQQALLLLYGQSEYSVLGKKDEDTGFGKGFDSKSFDGKGFGDKEF